MTQTFYVKPQEISVGFDNVKIKDDSIQHVPISQILRTLKLSLQIWKLLSRLKMANVSKKTFYFSLIQMLYKYVCITITLILLIL